MIVSWNWLHDYVSLDMDPAELAHRLAMAGLNHESTERVGEDLAIDLEVKEPSRLPRPSRHSAVEVPRRGRSRCGSLIRSHLPVVRRSGRSRRCRSLVPTFAFVTRPA